MVSPELLISAAETAMAKFATPNKSGVKLTTSTAAILGPYATDAARSSPNFDMILGATKKIAIITAVWIMYIKNTEESEKLRFFRNGVKAVKYMLLPK